MSTYITRRVCSLMAAILVPATAWAHPGHGVGRGDWSLRHYLTEPEHVLPGLALFLVVAVIWRLVRGANREHSAPATAKDPR
jgi:hypothetical protein